MPVECSYGEKKEGRADKGTREYRKSRASAREEDPYGTEEPNHRRDARTCEKNFYQIFILIPLPDILPTLFLVEFTLAKGYGSRMCFVKIRNRIFFLPRIVRILRFSQRFMNIPNRECQNIERRSAAGFLHDTHRGGRRAQARKGDKC